MGKFASKVIVLLLMPLYTAILAPEAFGIADLISQTANLIMPLACVGICDGIFRFALDSDEPRKVFSTGFWVLLIGTGISACLMPLLRLIDIFDGYVWLILAYVACANLHALFAQYIRAKGKMTLFALQGILNTILTVLLNLLFLLGFRMGVLGYVLSVVIADGLISLLLFFGAGLYREISPKHFDGRILRELLNFSIPYIPTTLLWMVTSVSDRYVVRYFCGEAATGLYAASYKIPTLLTLVCGVFIEAWQFSVVKDATKEERASFFGKVYGIYMGALGAGAAVLIFMSPIFTRLLLAESYYEAWQFIPILVIATLYSTLVSFMGSVYFVEKKSVFSMLTALSGAVVNVILNVVMIPKHGAMGAAVATLISYMAVYVIRAYDSTRYLRFCQHRLRLILNTLLLLAQSGILLLGGKYALVGACGCAVVIVAINAKALVWGILPLLQKIKRKKVEKN